MYDIEIRVNGEVFSTYQIKKEEWNIWLTTMENAAAEPDWHKW